MMGDYHKLIDELSMKWLEEKESRIESHNLNKVNKHFVYKIVNSATKKMMYIGETGNIFNRISNHPRMDIGRDVYFIELSSRDQRKKIELALIYHFKPDENVRIPTNQYLMPDGLEIPKTSDWRSLDNYSIDEWINQSS